jgi:predicted kinase
MMNAGDSGGRQCPQLAIPANALVMLVGASGSGKSAWAARWFTETQIVSSDRCRALVADDEANQAATPQAFAVFHEIIRSRLELGRLAVADSTALSDFARHRLRETASRAGAPIHALVFCTPPNVLLRHNSRRARRVPEDLILRHAAELRELVISGLFAEEGYDAVHLLFHPELPRPVMVAPAVSRAAAIGDEP